MKIAYYFVLSILFIGCYSQSDFNKQAKEELPVSQKNTTIESEKYALKSDSFTSKVVAIQDGDTIELLLVYDGKEAKERRGKNLRIRFAHIDTPERGKPFYKVAKQFTANACFGENVTIKHENEFDRYGRLIGEIMLPDGRNLNQELVKSGLALHFKKYSDSEIYADLEIQAQKSKLGIWDK